MPGDYKQYELRNMLKMTQILKYIKQRSPHDYEKYMTILYNAGDHKYVRKVKALKFAIKQFYILRYSEKISGFYGTESRELTRKEPLEYIPLLMKYDVISFDVFDTLILRKVLNDLDVFHLTGIKLQITGFREIRKMAEDEARRRMSMAETEDVPLSDIYTVIQEWYGLDMEEGMKTEQEIEYALCTENPYWHPVFNELIRLGKQVIITTDMYLPEHTIRNILEKNQYAGHRKIYVSCAQAGSKRSGKLYDIIKEDIGREKKYIHIGDRFLSDYKMARKKGWDAIYYEGVHTVGKKYRNMCTSILAESVSGGILDVELHNGIVKQEPLEEFGFHYYGKLHVGYCQWLDRLSREKKFDKLLFVSRDGYLLHRLYNKFFGSIPGEYIYVSRYALSQIIISEDMELFLQQNIEPRASGGTMKLHSILKKLGLEELEKELYLEGLSGEEKLNRRNYMRVRSFFYKKRSQIAEIYQESCLAAEQYFSKLTESCSRICIVDIGWFGTCTRGISVFLNKHMGWGGSISGAQIGIECGRQNIEMYAQNQLYSYVFSPDYHSEIYRKHDFGLGNVMDEIVFSAPGPSLHRYRLDEEGNCVFEFLEEPVQNTKIVTKIQKGVWEYAEEYFKLERKLGIELTLSAECTYEPILKICRKRRYINALLGKYAVHRNAGAAEEERVEVRKV